MIVTIWHKKEEETVEYTNPRTGKTIEFDSAHELVQFLLEKVGKNKITIKVEEA